MKLHSNLFRSFAYAFVFMMVFVHLGLTLFDNKTLWPLSPYNMFNKRKPLMQTRVHVILISKSGKEITVSPFHLFPYEYFKSFRIIERSLLLAPKRQREFYKIVLKRINDNPHYGFDEIYASPFLGKNDPFVGLKLLKGQFNLEKFKNEESFRPDNTEVVLSLGDIHE